MELRSYQLQNLRLGENGRAARLVSILQRMLPAYSKVTEDRSGNTLHILSTVSAQQAAFEFITAMDDDVSATKKDLEGGSIPIEVKKALESLASARADKDQLLNALRETTRGTEERVSAAIDAARDRSEGTLGRMIITAVFAGCVVICVLLLGLVVILKRAHRKTVTQVSRETAAVALLPNQNLEAVVTASREQHDRTKELQKLMESFSIAYQADRQRSSMALEIVAKRHVELSATLEQMSQLRRELGENAGKIFLDVNRESIDRIIQQASDALQTKASEVGLIAENASRKMEETASRLEIQNARTEALANELERTQREVDALFDKLKLAQESALSAQSEANEQRRIAYEKTTELARKEAALAGLSLLIQEPIESILDTVNNHSTQPPSKEDVPLEAEPDGSYCREKKDTLRDDAPPESGVSDSTHENLCPQPKYTFRIVPAA